MGILCCMQLHKITNTKNMYGHVTSTVSKMAEREVSWSSNFVLFLFISTLLWSGIECFFFRGDDQETLGIRISKKGMIATTCCHKQITSLIQSRILSDPDFVDGRSVIRIMTC